MVQQRVSAETAQESSDIFLRRLDETRSLIQAKPSGCTAKRKDGRLQERASEHDECHKGGPDCMPCADGPVWLH